MEVEYLMKVSLNFFSLFFVPSLDKKNIFFHPHKNKVAGERMKGTLGWIFLISCFFFFFSRFLIQRERQKGWKKRRLCKRGTGGGYVYGSFRPRSIRLSGKIFFKDKRLLNTRNTSAPWTSFFHSMTFFSSCSFRSFIEFSLVCHQDAQTEWNLRDFPCFVKWRIKIDVHQAEVKNLRTRRWVVNSTCDEAK